MLAEIRHGASIETIMNYISVQRQLVNGARSVFLTFGLGIVFDSDNTAVYISAKTKNMWHRETVIFHIAFPFLLKYTLSAKKEGKAYWSGMSSVIVPV